MKQDRFSLSQIFPQNPILQESLEYKNLYIAKLKEYILLLGRENEKFEKAELQFYQKIIMQSHNGTRKHEFSYTISSGMHWMQIRHLSTILIPTGTAKRMCQIFSMLIGS